MSQLSDWLYGSFERTLPMAQVLVAAENDSPKATPPASHFAFGATTLRRTATSAMAPATNRTCRSSAHLSVAPSHDVAAGRFPCVHAAVEQVESLLARRGELGMGLARAGSGLADEHDRMLDIGQVLGVFAERVERNVERAGDVHGVELAAGADVEHADQRIVVHQLTELSGADGVGVGKCCSGHDVSIGWGVGRGNGKGVVWCSSGGTVRSAA